MPTTATPSDLARFDLPARETYRFIEAYGYHLGSTASYIATEIAAARADGAPADSYTRVPENGHDPYGPKRWRRFSDADVPVSLRLSIIANLPTADQAHP